MADAVMERVIEELNALKVGKYKGYVTNTDSPNKPGWIEIQPIIQDARRSANRFWAEPCVPLAGPNANCFWIPDVGSTVWYEYAGGKISHPIWTGCVWSENHPLEKADMAPAGKLLRVGAMEILIDEDEGSVSIRNGEQSSISVTSDKISLEATAIELVVNGKTVKLDAAGFDVLQGVFKVV